MKNVKKINFLKTVALLGFVSMTALVSCEDDLQPDYPAGREKPVVSFEAASYTVDEGKDLEITLLTSEAINEDMFFQIDIDKSTATATDLEDFEIALNSVDLDYGTVDSYRIVFPKFATSYKFKISAILDDLVEQGESFKITLSSRGNLNGDVDPAASTTVVNINQRGSNILEFSFNYEKSFEFGGVNYQLCSGLSYDNDYIYTDAAGNMIDYLAATASCNEVGEFDLDELAPGTYHIVQNLYDNGGLSGAAISPAFSVPTTVAFSRVGSTLNGTYVQTAANAPDSDALSDPDGLNLYYVVSFTLDANGIVTIFDETTASTISVGKGALPKFKMNKKLKK